VPLRRAAPLEVLARLHMFAYAAHEALARFREPGLTAATTVALVRPWRLLFAVTHLPKDEIPDALPPHVLPPLSVLPNPLLSHREREGSRFTASKEGYLAT